MTMLWEEARSPSPSVIMLSLYLATAALVYGWTVLPLLCSEPPDSLRESVGLVLACTVVAAFWPPVVLWRLMLGPAPA